MQSSVLVVAAILLAPIVWGYVMYRIGRSAEESLRGWKFIPPPPLPEQMEIYYSKTHAIWMVARFVVLLIAVIIVGTLVVLNALNMNRSAPWIITIRTLLPLIPCVLLLAPGFVEYAIALSRLDVPALQVDRNFLMYKNKAIPWRCIRSINLTGSRGLFHLMIWYTDRNASFFKTRLIRIRYDCLSGHDIFGTLKRYLSERRLG